MEITKEIADIVVPDGYKIVKDDSLLMEEKLQEEILQLEELIKNTPVPSDAELIESGKMFHPYYDIIMRLEMLKNELR